MVSRIAVAAFGVAVLMAGIAVAAEKPGGKADRGAPPPAPPAPATPTVPSKPTPSAAAPSATAPVPTSYGDWLRLCRPATADTPTAPAPPAAPALCEGTQLLRKSGDGTDLAQYRLTPAGRPGRLRLSVLVPANARMDVPVRVVRQGEAKEFAVLAWTVCTLGGCRAEAEVAAADLDAFARAAAEKSAVVYLDSAARPVTLPMVANGLPELIAALSPKAK